jgi:uncharacterized membrane protein YsdA (DUF1294 family)
MKQMLLFLTAVNLIGFLMMAYDKSQAKQSQRRIPEKRLFLVAAAGGALGCWIGMRLFRHKTKHASFVVGMPALFALNVICVYLLMEWLTS